MKLKAYPIVIPPPPLVPAPVNRAWMDASPGQSAYRCLPLAIANAYGWQMLAPFAISIGWNGGPHAADISIQAEDGVSQVDLFAVSHFNLGIVTMHTGYLFRTEPGWHLLATGPFNEPKDGIVALTGVMESEWLPFPFTMNWQLTRPGRVRFAKGEPYCQIYPVPQGMLEPVQPEIQDLASDPMLAEQYRLYRDSRSTFLERQKAGDPEVVKQGWQRHYFQGRLPDGSAPDARHETRLRLKPPVDRRGG